MKTISLKNVKNALNRDEMRIISGGSFSCYCNGSYNCQSGSVSDCVGRC
ncbi:TIGR04149 family rSAM-modified RiPP [Flavobacterium sp. MMLR14_040]